MIGGVVAAVGVIAAISYTVGGGGDLGSPPPDDGLGITLPDASSSAPAVPTSAAPTTAATTAPPTTAPPTTAAPTTVETTLAPTTAAPTTVSPATVAPTTPVGGGPTTTGPTGGGVSIESIVPDLAASRRYLATPDQVQSLIDRLLQRGGRHDVALPGNVPTLCATVTLSGPIELSGRWERDGDEIDETGGIVLRTAPGFGDCIDNDGQPLEPGAYQYIATDEDGTDSAVGNFVVGAARLEQQFVNNGEEDVCAILVAPSTTDFFEDFVFSSPMRPGSSVIIPIADVSQDVEIWGCAGAADDDETTPTRSDFDFDPTPGEPQPLDP